MAEGNRTSPQIRRIVTGHDSTGKAVVWKDLPVTNHKYPDEGMSSSLIWVTDSAPTDFMIDKDEGDRVMGTAPPLGGTRFSVLELQPGNKVHGLHRTDSLDYVICLSGQVDMLLDDSIVTMRLGDIMVQCGTNHAWVNRGTEVARIACILIDGVPKRESSISGVQDAW